jgi:hypothetical protein
MNREPEVVAQIVEKIINNGVLDELVVASLENALDLAFEDLERLSNKKYLEAHHWQDYAENLQFAHSCIKVLRWFTCVMYDQEQVKANQYSLKIEELY